MFSPGNPACTKLKLSSQSKFYDASGQMENILFSQLHFSWFFKKFKMPFSWR